MLMCIQVQNFQGAGSERGINTAKWHNQLLGIVPWFGRGLTIIPELNLKY